MQKAKSYICQMKFSGTTLLVLLSINVFAQINILVKSETSQKFELGLDGFYQSDLPCEAILLNNLDTSFHFLRIRLVEENIEFSKKIQFYKKGTYSFVIDKNFKGTYQLRYRGEGKSLASNQRGKPVKMDRPWVAEPEAQIVANRIEIETVSDKTPITPVVLETQPALKISSTEDSLTIDSVQIVVNNRQEKKSVQEKVEIPEVIKVVDSSSNSTSEEKLTGQVTLESKPKKDSLSFLSQFESMLEELSKEEFEFNKLNKAKTFLISNAISTDQIKLVFKEFKYDNTRIQFLGFAVERLIDSNQLKTLVDSFEYDLTKERFRKEYLK